MQMSFLHVMSDCSNERRAAERVRGIWDDTVERGIFILSPRLSSIVSLPLVIASVGIDFVSRCTAILPDLLASYNSGTEANTKTRKL